MVRRSAQQADVGSLGPVVVIEAAPPRFDLSRKTFARERTALGRSSPKRNAVADDSAIIITC